MIVLLDTANGICRLTLVDDDTRYESEWQADRQLARGLLAYLRDKLADRHKEFHDITGFGVFQGPGSFTGLRIGLTVLNTMAETLQVPIVGATGETWRDTVLARLENGDNERIVLPQYGRDARITTPRK